jgi:hypothetical protein
VYSWSGPLSVQIGHWADIAASQQDCAKNVP